MATLTHGSSTTPLTDFNAQFETLHSCRRLTPVYDLLGLINTSGVAQPATSDTDIPAVDPSTESNNDYVDLPDLELPSDSDDDEPEEDVLDEDLFAQSPTLTRLDEADVELDMDDVPEWYLDEDDSDSDSDGDDA
ncbi:hypothetical protein B0H10DRAFT_2233576 [Mycena sp. CBHHK59/15]|nr:hypothetical protein B0H10DRAFT_2233576 [Mycena sp. CBHHK59/15]